MTEGNQEVKSTERKNIYCGWSDEEQGVHCKLNALQSCIKLSLSQRLTGALGGKNLGGELLKLDKYIPV